MQLISLDSGSTSINGRDSHSIPCLWSVLFDHIYGILMIEYIRYVKEVKVVATMVKDVYIMSPSLLYTSHDSYTWKRATVT